MILNLIFADEPSTNPPAKPTEQPAPTKPDEKK